MFEETLWAMRVTFAAGLMIDWLLVERVANSRISIGVYLVNERISVL